MKQFWIFVFLVGVLQAKHGSTEAWQKEVNAQAKKQRELVLNENLPLRWATETRELEFALETHGEGKKHYRLDLESGDVVGGKVEGKTAKSLEVNQFFDRRRERQRSSEISPDGKWTVSIHDRVVVLSSEDESREIVTPIPEGSQWDREVRWHPDSKCFALTYRSNHPVRKVHLVRSSPKGKVQPEHEIHSYAKPGDKLNNPYPVIFHIEKEEPILGNRKLIGEAYSIGQFRWDPKRHLLNFRSIERGFGKVALHEIDADQRTQRILASEQSDKFVHVFEKSYYRFLEEKGEILWLSERTGFNHLYVLDRTSGEVLRQLTDGEWVVRKVLGVDEGKRTAMLQVSGYYKEQDPYYQHYGLVDLDSGELTMLTRADGNHQISFSPDRKYFVNTWSRVDQPPVYDVYRTSDVEKIATLNRSNLEGLTETGWQVPERFVCPDRNGRYEIHGVIWRPRNFEKDRKYPVIENIYAGPHGAFVPKSWSSWAGHRSELVEAGFIVVQIDGLGTNHRGRDFQQVAYQNLKDSGFPDRIKWLKGAASKYPELDLTRVGIYGGSAGGQSSLAALLHHGDFYKAAAADCGCHDNRVDKMWWNEQWLDWPINDSYVENSNRTHIKNLTGALMLTVGEMDRNVDPSSTYQIVDDLIRADKDFEFYMIPNGGHGSGDSPHFRRKRIDFFKRHLMKSGG